MILAYGKIKYIAPLGATIQTLSEAEQLLYMNEDADTKEITFQQYINSGLGNVVFNLWIQYPTHRVKIFENDYDLSNTDNIQISNSYFLNQYDKIVATVNVNEVVTYLINGEVVEESEEGETITDDNSQIIVQGADPIEVIQWREFFDRITNVITETIVTSTYNLDFNEASIYNLSFSDTLTMNIVNPLEGGFITVFIKETSGFFPVITWVVPGGYDLKWPDNAVPTTNEADYTDRYDFQRVGDTIYASVIQNYLP